LLQAAQKNVRELHKKAASLRASYLEEQAVLPDGNNDPKAAGIVKAEELKCMFKKLRSYLRPNQHSSLSHVMVPANGRQPKQATDWKRISDPEEVKTNILERNQTHFGQSYGTPFTKGELCKIPFNGRGPITDSIIEGTARSTKHVIQMVLDALKKPEGIPDIKNMITMEEFGGELNKWKETTSTSPITKCHLGHYKCLVQIIESEKETPNLTKQLNAPNKFYERTTNSCAMPPNTVSHYIGGGKW
jgi:hypothetical protein